MLRELAGSSNIKVTDTHGMGFYIRTCIYIYTVWINLMIDSSTTTMLSVPGSHWLCWLILNHGMVIQGHLSQDSIYVSFTIRIYLALKDTILLYHCRVAGYFWMGIHRVKCRKPNIYILCEYPSLSISLFYSLSIIYIYIIVQYTYVCIYRPSIDLNLALYSANLQLFRA